MIEGEDKTENNPYRLPPEALRPPKTGIRKWFRDLVALQREGIDNGVMPQNIRGVTWRMQEAWRRKVWNYHLSKLTPEERRRIELTTRPGESKHWLGMR